MSKIELINILLGFYSSNCAFSRQTGLYRENGVDTVRILKKYLFFSAVSKYIQNHVPLEIRYERQSLQGRLSLTVSAQLACIIDKRK